MAGPNVDLSLVVVITTLASTVFNPAVAAVVGPYVVIIVCAMGGAAVALMQAEKRGRFKAFVFFFGATLMAMFLTVPAALLVTAFYKDLQDHWLFAPLAFGLGYLGDKWGSVLPWLGSKLNALVDLYIQLRSPK